MTELMHDVRLSLRTLRRSPAFAIVTIVTLAVAIGANTAIFSVVDGVLLRPLPYPEPDRLVTVSVDASAAGVDALPFSDRGYWHFAEQNRSFTAFGGYSTQDVPLVGGGPPEQVTAALLTRSAFEAVGVAPARGRLPTAEESAPGGPLVALLGYPLWQTRYGADPDVVGRTIDLNGRSREIIGVMPAGYAFPSPEVDVWLPFPLDPASENVGGHHISAVARLAEGATLESAVADAERLVARFDEVGYGPQWFTNVLTGRASVTSFKEALVGDARRPLLILLATVGFVLLIACSNIANLFLLRAEARTRETAVRVALGAGRARLIRYVLVESLLLAVLGGAAGVLLAWLGTRMLLSAAPAAIPRLDEIGITGNVLLFTLGVSLLAGLLFGVLPGLRSFSHRMVAALRDGGRGATIGRERHRARGLLVVTQVALALLLLIGAGLMVRSFQELKGVDPGFHSEGLVTFRLAPPPSRYATPETTAQFYDELLDRLRALPGVTAAGAVTQLPLSGPQATVLATEVEEFPTGPDDFPPTFHVRRVTPGYFEALRIPVLDGRGFEPRDHQQRLGTVVVTQGVKDRFWPDVSPLGRRIAPSSAWASIVGVVGDVHQLSLESATEPTIYLPMLDSAGGGVRPMSIALRTGGSALALMPMIRSEVRALDPDLPITDLRTMSSVVGDSMSRTSFTASLLVLAALVGLFLGAIGIYGVVSYNVTQRTVELGIRQALGADVGAIRSMVLRQGVGLAAIGVALGLVAAAAAGRVMTSILFGVRAFDPVTFAAGPAVFLLVAAIACLLPAQRATRIPPSEALRAD